MNRAEKLTELSRRIAALPVTPVNRREGVLSYFIGILGVLTIGEAVVSDEVVHALERAVFNAEKEAEIWEKRSSSWGVEDAERAKA